MSWPPGSLPGALLALASLAASAGNVVELDFTSTESPPVWSEKLPGNGLGGELLKALAEEAHVRARIHYLPLKRYEKLNRDNRLGNPYYFLGQEFTAVIPILATKSVFCFYQPHHPQGLTFERLADLQGKTLGVIRGTLEDKNEFSQFGITVEENTSLDALFKKLRAGRVDLILVLDIVAHAYVDKLFPDENTLFRQIEVPGGSTPIALMLASSTPDARQVADKLRLALDRIMANGVYLGILKKYYADNQFPKDWQQTLRSQLAQFRQTPIILHEQ